MRRTTIAFLGTTAAVLFLLPAMAAALAAPKPPPIIVLHQSLSAGLSLDTVDCAEALKSLTGRVLAKSRLTHVNAVGAPLLAYTLEGPQGEVAILVCVPSEIAK